MVIINIYLDGFKTKQKYFGNKRKNQFSNKNFTEQFKNLFCLDVLREILTIDKRK